MGSSMQGMRLLFDVSCLPKYAKCDLRNKFSGISKQENHSSKLTHMILVIRTLSLVILIQIVILLIVSSKVFFLSFFGGEKERFGLNPLYSGHTPGSAWANNIWLLNLFLLGGITLLPFNPSQL